MNLSPDSLVTNPILLAVNFISFISCLLIFYQGFKAVKPLKTAFKLIMLISFCDFVVCISNFTSMINFEEVECPILGFLTSFATWSGLFCCSLISLVSYLKLKNYGNYTISKVLRGAVLLSSIGSVFFALMYYILLFLSTKNL